MLVADIRKRLSARLLAAMACFGAGAAMPMSIGVLRAFIAARLAGDRASLDHAPEDLHVRAGSAGRKRAGCRTDIGAIEIEADALPELVDTALRQAGIGTGCARLGAGVALLDTADKTVADAAFHIGVAADHIASLMHAVLRSIDDVIGQQHPRKSVASVGGLSRPLHWSWMISEPARQAGAVRPRSCFP